MNDKKNFNRMATNEKKSKILEAELNLKITKIQDIFDRIFTNISIYEGRDIIAFVGPTKAGKSTLINCLMKNPLICKKDPYTEETHIVKDKNEAGPKIGGSGQSETAIPKGYANLQGTNFPMWDFPGFGDNKGTEQEIANAAAYERVLRPQRSIRFVLVIPIELIKSDNPMKLFKLLSEIFLICPNLADCLCIVATKSEKGTASAWLKKAYDSKFSNANTENSKTINQAKMVIQTVLKKNHCIDFKAPIMVENALEQKFVLPNIEDIVLLIRSLKGTSVSDFPLVISDQAKSEIQQLHMIYNNKLTNEVNEVCKMFNNFIKNKINAILETKVGDSSFRLSLFQKGKTETMEIKNKSSNCREFIIEVEKLGFHIPSLAEHLDNFTFIERVHNMYKLESQGVVESSKHFFKTIMMTLNAVTNKYSDLVKQMELAIDKEYQLEMTYNNQRKSEKAEHEKHMKRIDEDRAREKADNEELYRRMNEDIKKQLEELDNREKMMNEQRRWERAENERRIQKMEEQRERYRDELDELRMDMEWQRQSDLNDLENAFSMLQRKAAITKEKEAQKKPAAQAPQQQLQMLPSPIQQFSNHQFPVQQFPVQQCPIHQLPMQQLPHIPRCQSSHHSCQFH